MNLGVSGAGSAEGAAARGWFKELPRLFQGSCHIWGWGQTWGGGGGEAAGWVPGGVQGLQSKDGCPGLGSEARGESSLREQKPAAVLGREQGWGDVLSWGSGMLAGPSSPHFLGLGCSGCCSLGICTLPMCQHHGEPGTCPGTTTFCPSKVTCRGQMIREWLQPGVTEPPLCCCWGAGWAGCLGG